MAYAAVKILDGYGEKPIPIEKADKFLDFISDLAGDFVENDTSLQEVGQDAPTLLFDTLKHSGEKGIIVGQIRNNQTLLKAHLQEVSQGLFSCKSGVNGHWSKGKN